MDYSPYFFSLRPAQWIKNLFIFIPLIFSRSFIYAEAWIDAALAFIFFSLAASCIYLLNDICDLKSDKQHPAKRLRPLAAGKVTKSAVLTMAVFLAAASLAGGFFVNFHTGLLFLFYFAFNFAYYFLKKIVIVDVMCLALFFILRVMIGAAAIGVATSHWLLICVAVLALFLGFNKRRHEIRILGRISGEHRKVLEKYSLYFIDQMISVLTASSVIFYTLYTIDPNTTRQFGANSLIYTLPFVYYGIFRYLYIVHKRGKGGDPTRVLLSDYMMIINLILWGASCVVIIGFRL